MLMFLVSFDCIIERVQRSEFVKNRFLLSFLRMIHVIHNRVHIFLILAVIENERNELE
jgi:hypothetical protein